MILPNWRADPRFWLALLVVAQLIFWTLVPWLFATSLPLDVVSDGLAWGHEWQWGYYKHPPLPSWIVELFFDAFGNVGPFLLSQIAISATYIFVFLLGREMMPARWAAAGALLLAGVYYFSVPSPEFNHNVAQMPLWAAATLFYYKAWKSGATRWWLALGLTAGLGLLAKYSTALLLVTMLAHLACARSSRAALRTTGPYLAIAVCIAVVSPHVVWLFHHGFPTLHYAIGRAGKAAGVGGRVVGAAKFLSAQAADLAPAFLAAAIAGLLVPNHRPLRGDENLRFLLWLTLGPPALATMLSIASGLGVRDMWGTPMWNLVGLGIVQAGTPHRDTASLMRLGSCVVGLFVIGLTAYALANVVVPEIENRPSRIQWPDREVAQKFALIWRKDTRRPLRIVAADGWLGGLIAMGVAPRPSVWIDASFAKSPWVTPESLKRDGALVLWRITASKAPPPALAALQPLKIMGVESFGWPSTPKAQPLRIGYGILPPTGPQR